MAGKPEGTVQDQQGNAISGATVLLTDHTTGATVTLYTDETLTTTKANPLTTDNRGYWEAYMQSGTYDRTITYKGDVLVRDYIEVGEFDVGNVDSIQFNVLGTEPTAERTLYWGEDDKTLNIVEDNGVIRQIGQEVGFRGVNKTGSQIDDGTPVYITGATGSRPEITPSDANIDGVSGVATTDIANNATAQVTKFGIVRGIDTSPWAEGTTLYLSETAGQLTSTAPGIDADVVEVGEVLYQHANNGEILVDIRSFKGVFNSLKLTPTSSDPTSPIEGMMWYNNTDNRFYGRNDTETLVIGTVVGAAELYVSDGSTAQSIPSGATATKLTGFTTGRDAGTGAVDEDVANDQITLNKNGWYEVTVTLSLKCGTANTEADFEVYLDGVAQQNIHVDRKFANNDVGAMSMSGFVEVTGAPDNIDVRCKHDGGSAVNFTMQSCNMRASYLGT